MMKTSFLKKMTRGWVLILTALTCSHALAGINLPRDTFETSELDKAKAEARAKNRPIAFLYTDKNSTCPLCDGVGRTMIDELGRGTVLVYVPKMGDVPENVAATLASRGKFIPKVAIFDPDVEKSIGLVTYEDVKEKGSGAFKDLKKAMREAKKVVAAGQTLWETGQREERFKRLGKALEAYEQSLATGNQQAAKEIERLETLRADQLLKAREKKAAGEYYEAALMLEKVKEAFGETRDGGAAAELAAMKNNPEIRAEVSAELLFRKAKMNKDKKLLQPILEKYPDTKAAAKARDILKG
ncbi:MAG: hypothetical protein RRC34_04040 [Lentisphaeria bacterium]|nr:hypothetical protein [Lentisphaeria bacterium]